MFFCPTCFFTLLMLWEKSPILNYRASSLLIADFDLEYFWRWTDFGSYVQFIAAFTAVMGLLTFIFISNWLYIETIGFLAVFAEAMLGAPQFYRNLINKSTQGMR